MIKRTLILLALIATLNTICIPQSKPIGIIYFENGYNLEFVQIKSITGATSTNFPTLSFTENSLLQKTYNYGTITIDYQGTQRTIPFSKLKSFQIETFKIVPNYYLNDITAKVVTSNNTTFETSFRVLNTIEVYALDELTGELKKFDVKFVQKNKLNVRKIIFY